MHIGHLRATNGGFAGRLRTLTIDLPIVLVPAERSANGNAPDLRVLAGGGEDAREIGAGWRHSSDKAGDYIAIQIDDPLFPEPLRINLFERDKGEHVLVWSRSPRREAAA